MIIELNITDKDGDELNIGDKIELYDWGVSRDFLGIGELIFCSDEGRLTTKPEIVEDAYDFYTKALKYCKKHEQ